MNFISTASTGILIAAIFFVVVPDTFAQSINRAKPGTSVNVLAIGNAHYSNYSLFDSYDDINISAKQFLNCFKGLGSMRIVQSVLAKPLSKKTMLEAICNFIELVETKNGEGNIGIIYYCGHGISSLAGSMYFIPGDTDAGLEDSTFEYLSQKLLNVDEINQMIVHAQLKEQSTSRYIIIGDCCSNQALSKWYNGIGFHFSGDKEIVVSYDSAAIRNSNSINSALSATANLTFSSLADTSPKEADSTRPSINEFDFIGEIIRSQTMMQKGDMIIWSSPVGKATEMVSMPGNIKNSSKVGPICRRTILYRNKYKKLTLDDYVKKLTLSDFDKSTNPALINRSRNKN